MYVLGVGTKADVQRGLELLDGACAEGHPGAMLAVGKCLRDGVGVAVDVASAVTWIKRAAALRYAPAAHEMAELFETGITATGAAVPPYTTTTTSADATNGPSSSEGAAAVVVERDLVAAFRTYKMAADADHAPSQLNIAKLFLLGASLRVDESPCEATVKARYWLERAAANGSMEARSLLQRHGGPGRHEDPHPAKDGEVMRSARVQQQQTSTTPQAATAVDVTDATQQPRRR